MFETRIQNLYLKFDTNSISCFKDYYDNTDQTYRIQELKYSNLELNFNQIILERCFDFFFC